MTYKSVIFIFSGFFFFSSFFLPAFAEGDASLYLSPPIGSYAVSEAFSVAVLINTNEKTINTAEGKISFNKDELAVVSVSKEGSILTSWPSEPEFSNKEGFVSFGGSTGKEGYRGTDGKILSIIFRALKSNASTVKFSMGAAIAATDGFGTNILTSLNAGQYELSPKEIIPSLDSIASSTADSTFASSTAPVEASSTPFVIVSSNHPDQTAWYRATTTELSWTLPPDIESVRFLFDQSPTSTPKTVYSPAPLKKSIKNIPEGVSYFHFQKWTDAKWTDMIHFRIGVDITPPKQFSISPVFTEQYGFAFNAEDTVSGIAKYNISIDAGTVKEWRDDGTHVYVPTGLTPGDHTLYAKAVDFAGNFLERSIPFTVLPVSVPIMEKVPETNIPVGSTLVLSWKASPDAKVRVFVSKNGGDPIAGDAVKNSDDLFMFTMKDLVEEGSYAISAISIIKGVESKHTETVILIGSSSFVVFGKQALHILGSGYSKIFFSIFSIFVLFYGWRFWGKRLEKKKHEMILPAVHEEKKHIPIVGQITSQQKNFQVRIQKRS